LSRFIRCIIREALINAAICEIVGSAGSPFSADEVKPAELRGIWPKTVVQ
jgi:hypothetical protein